MQTSFQASPTGRHVRRGSRTASFPGNPTWQRRAIADATAVQRAVRGIATGASVIGLSNALNALDRGDVRELLETARFRELHPNIAARARELERLSRLSVHELAGAAAVQLDIVGEGVGAMLRRAGVPARQPASLQPETASC